MPLAWQSTMRKRTTANPLSNGRRADNGPNHNNHNNHNHHHRHYNNNKKKKKKKRPMTPAQCEWRCSKC
jgi:hypothetical protein